MVDTDGPGVITHIWLGGKMNHSHILRIYWDDCEQPSVEAPVSAFFGNAYDENIRDRDENLIVLNSEKILLAPYASYNSYWEMPFYKHCKITLENRSDKIMYAFYAITGWKGEFRKIVAISMPHIVRSARLPEAELMKCCRFKMAKAALPA